MTAADALHDPENGPADQPEIRFSSGLVGYLTLHDRPEDASANTLAPLVINSRTRAAAQVVLTGQPFSLRQPLLAS